MKSTILDQLRGACIPRIASTFAVLVLTCAAAGCTTNNYNCNVKDACPTSGTVPS